jgi:hypothetical protein
LSPRGTRSAPSIPIPTHLSFVGDSPFMGWLGDLGRTILARGRVFGSVLERNVDCK